MDMNVWNNYGLLGLLLCIDITLTVFQIYTILKSIRPIQCYKKYSASLELNTVYGRDCFRCSSDGCIKVVKLFFQLPYNKNRSGIRSISRSQNDNANIGAGLTSTLVKWLERDSPLPDIQL